MQHGEFYRGNQLYGEVIRALPRLFRPNRELIPHSPIAKPDRTACCVSAIVRVVIWSQLNSWHYESHATRSPSVATDDISEDYEDRIGELSEIDVTGA